MIRFGLSNSSAALNNEIGRDKTHVDESRALGSTREITNSILIGKKKINITKSRENKKEPRHSLNNCNNNNNNTGSLTKPPPDSPAPRQRPRRELFENWSEYVDQTTGRPCYYNSENRAKSWKPPRRIGTSPITRVSILFLLHPFSGSHP